MSRWLSILVATWLASLSACGSSGSASGYRGGGDGIPGTNIGGGGGSSNGPNEPVSTPYAPASDDLNPELQPLAPTEVFAQADSFCPGIDANVAPTLTLGVGDPLGMASAGRVRELLNAHRAPVPATVRTRDFLNYFHARGSANAPTLEVALEMRPRSVAGVAIPLQYELYAEVGAMSLTTRPDLGLVVLVDTSSATPPDALEQAKDLLRAIGKVVTPTDEVLVMTTDSSLPTWTVESTSAAASLGTIADGLTAGVGATASDALTRALAEAQGLGQPWRRVLFVSNGALGSEADITLVESAVTAASPVYVSVASVGEGEAVQDDFLGKLAHAGRGAYVHAAAPGEADRLMTNNFGELFGTGFEDVSIKLSLPWFLTVLDESSPPGSTAPQFLAPGAAMRFVTIVKACNVDLMTKLGSSNVTLSVGATDVASGALLNTSGTLTLAELQPTNGVKPHLELAVATKAFVAALKAPTSTRLADAETLLTPLASQDPDAKDMLSLLQMHPAYVSP
jgi:hypothetical protein